MYKHHGRTHATLPLAPVPVTGVCFVNMGAAALLIWQHTTRGHGLPSRVMFGKHTADNTNTVFITQSDIISTGQYYIVLERLGWAGLSHSYAARV